MSSKAFCEQANRKNLIISRMREATANKHWFSDNISELRKKFLHKYVAIHQQKVLEVADDQDTLFKRLRKNKDLDMGVVAIEFVADEGIHWIL